MPQPLNATDSHRPLIGIVGASVRAAAGDAAASGYRVLASDRFGDTDLIDGCQHWIPLSHNGPLDWSERECWAAAAAVIPTGGIGHWQVAEQSPSANPPASGPPAPWPPLAYPDRSVYWRMQQPAELQAVAAAGGLRFPITTAAHFHPSAGLLALPPGGLPPPPFGGGGRWLFKPADHGGGVGIRSISQRQIVFTELAGNRSADQPADASSMTSFDRPAGIDLPPRSDLLPRSGWLPDSDLLPRSGWLPGWLQQYHGGWSIGASYLARPPGDRQLTTGPVSGEGPAGRQVIGLGAAAGRCYRRRRTDRWLYGGSIGPLALPQPLRATLRALGQAIADRFGLVGLFNVDLLVPRCGPPLLLEINPRYSASMELLPAAGRLIDAHLAAYQQHWGQISGAQCDQRLRLLAATAAAAPQAAVGYKRIVYARRSGRFDFSRRQLDVLARQLERTSDSLISVEFCDVPRQGQPLAADEPLLTVLVRQRRSQAGGGTQVPDSGPANGIIPSLRPLLALARRAERSIEEGGVRPS